jgi:hypothetical protein
MNKLSAYLYGATVMLILSGCANSAGSYHRLGSYNPESDLSHFLELHLETHSAEGVHMTAVDRERLMNKIVRRVNGRYKEAASGSNGPHTLFASLDISNYDEGNSFLRFLLAGLGQIHIEGELRLTDQNQTELGKYAVEKTFAWGGMYGLQTKIEDVEDGFAEAVAKLLVEMNKPI